MADVQIITAPPREDWHALLAADDESLVTQSPEWMDAARASGYRDASRLYIFADGQRILMPLAARTVVPGFSVAASMPHAWGVGGAISARPMTGYQLGYVLNDLASLPYTQIAFRANPVHGPLWEEAAPGQFVRVKRTSHVLSLEGGFDKVWAERFRKGARRGVQVAERRGVTIECDSTGALIPVFYELFQKAVERWAAIQREPLALARWRASGRDPVRKFEAIMRLGEGRCKIWLARVDGHPAAAILVLQGRNAQDTRAVMNQTLAGPSNANYLLEKHAIEDACRAGCKRYHLGESGDSKSLAYNKMRFGAEEYSYHEYRFERLPITALDHALRSAVKRAIGFRDVAETPDQSPEKVA